MNLQDKTILITGASRGIGRATAILAAQAGAKVAINYLKNNAAAKETLIRTVLARTVLIRGDVSKAIEAKKIIGTTKDELGSLDVLINNAGVVSWKLMMKEKLEVLHRMIDINVKGVINMTYHAIPVMRKQKGGGVIINIASGAGKTGYPHLAVYSASKFAVIGFTQGIGQELEEKNIRVYAVCPGMVATEMTGGAGMPPEKIARRVLEVATERLGLQPGEDTEVYQ